MEFLKTPRGEKIKEHNHPVDPQNVEVVKAVYHMKERCKDTLAKPSQIFAEGIAALPENVRGRMVKEDHLKRTFRNIKAGHNPKEPTLLTDLVIKEEWKSTGGPENKRFILNDNGLNAKERIIIFADDNCLGYLAAATTWYLDGNYSLAPRFFKQLKLQELGLQKTYMENPNLSTFCGKLDGLAFIPIEDVQKGMDHLKATPEGEEYSELINYFDATYISGTFQKIGNSSKTRNIAPMFLPKIWNVHEATLSDENRTNNLTEGWNNRFSNLVGQNHPSVWLLIKKMRMELAVDSAKLQNANLEPDVKRKRPSYQVLQERLKLLCQQYNNKVRDMKSFLNAISHNMRFKPKN
ncbi:unnamed protein product [Brassicogethes aeneus]|uniref:MULE transposase domain-containing protein n=1 Tax=Brassicogethes aeneus TaxID=1431903 RepID=A0A9P0BGQ8_BRAAE|nr:unnamed protein product [Brassicogethes aeneus]